MTDTLFSPLSVSADGKANAYVLQCPAAGQAMNYAACLHRVSQIRASSNGDGAARVPRDWSVCDDAMGCGKCVATDMRQQEELEGKSLFFRAREVLHAAAETARKWFMPGDPIPGAGKAAPRRPRSRFDALDDAGTYADALSMTAEEANAAPKPRPVIPIAAVGETPLQIARRLKAEREAATN